MTDGDKTEDQLVNELMELRQRVAELKAAAIAHKRSEEAPRRTEQEKSLILDSITQLKNQKTFSFGLHILYNENSGFCL